VQLGTIRRPGPPSTKLKNGGWFARRERQHLADRVEKIFLG
jgi:hypothetical protein